VRLDADSRLRLAGEGTLVLERGAVYVDSGGGSEGSAPFVVETPLGAVREVGTQYEVRLADASVRIRVREGTVTLDAGARVLEVPTSSELMLHADGTATTREVPIHGAEWEWVARVTRLPDLEGKSARVFLDHVARERGWRLRFSDAETERAAARARVFGSIGRLGLDDALDAVLPTIGMTWTVEDGTLTVASEGDGV
jgi:ferric-dicitrate binding protein FerR (iron transport regulator)